MQDFSADTFLTRLPAGAEGHFLLHFYAAISRLLTHPYVSGGDQQHFVQLPFLTSYRATVQSWMPEGLDPAHAGVWWDEQIAHWEKQTAAHLPLRVLATEAGLSANEIRLLIAVGIIEEDVRF